MSTHLNSFRTLALAGATALMTLGLSASPMDPERQSSLEPEGGGIAVFPPGATERWIWKIDVSKPPLSSGVGVQWQLDYWDGSKSQGKSPLGSATGAFTAFELIPEKLGWAQLTANLVDAKGQTLLSEETTLTVGKADRTPNRAFRYSLCAHSSWLNEDQYKLSILTIGASGIDILRDSPSWGDFQPAKGQWNFVKMDRLVKDTGAYGVELSPLFGYSAQWASTGDQNSTDFHKWSYAAPQIDPWLEYVRTVVGRYKGQVHYWEVWNEPDWSFWLDAPDKYVDLFNKTAAAIKQVDPSAKVMNGGLTFIEGKPYDQMRHDLIATSDKANWSIFAYHSYMTLAQLIEKAKEVDDALAGTRFADTPRWLNESGTQSLIVDGDREQTLQLIKKISYAPALGIQAYVWYDLRDDGADASTAEHRFGLVDFYYRPHPAFAAYQNLIRELASRKYFPPPATSAIACHKDGIWAAAYAGDQGEHRLLVWKEGKNSLPVVLHWPKGTMIKGLDDAMGNPAKFSNIGEDAVVVLGEEPVYVAFTGQPAYPEATCLLSTPSILASLPGESSPLEISLHNPAAESVSLSLEGTLGEGGKSLFQQTLQLAPGEDKNMTADIAWPVEAVNPGKINLKIGFSTATPLDAFLPYQAAHIVPRANNNPSISGTLKPQIVLNRRENVVNLSEGLAQAERDWKGPNDLSASANVFYDDTALHIVVVAEDDVHYQPGNLLRLWDGDGLQLALKLNDSDIKYLQLSLALSPEKGVMAWVDKASSTGTIALGSLPPEVKHTVQRNGTQTTYTIDLPWADLGANGPPKNPFRMNFLVNDNDGGGRKQWIELSPGIGLFQNPSLFQLFICK